MKEWSEVHKFIDGNVSLFTQVLNRLEKRKVTFPKTKSEFYPDEEVKSINKKKTNEELVNRGKQLMSYIGEVIQAQIEDKELIISFKEQIKKTQSDLQEAINNSLKEELEDLISLNDTFNQLNNLLDNTSDEKVKEEIHKLTTNTINEEQKEIKEVSVNGEFEFSEKEPIKEDANVVHDRTLSKAKNPFRAEPQGIAFDPPSNEFFTNIQPATNEFPAQASVFNTNFAFPNLPFRFSLPFENNPPIPQPLNNFDTEKEIINLEEPELSPILNKKPLNDSIDGKMNELKQKIEELKKSNADIRMYNELLAKSNEEVKQKHLDLFNLYTEHRSNAEIELNRLRQEIALVDNELAKIGNEEELNAENERIKQENGLLERKIREMQDLLPVLTDQNAKLLEEKNTIIANIENLKKTIRGLGTEVPQILESALYDAKVTHNGKGNQHVIEELNTRPTEESNSRAHPIGAGFYSNDVHISKPMVNPVELAKSQKETRYKNAIVEPKGIWYEDHILQISYIRTINKKAKVVEFTSFFGNRMPDCNLKITKCDLGLHDTKSLKIVIENIPEEIEPLKQATCNVRIRATRFFSTYNYFTIQYETAKAFRNMVTLKLPVNVLMLCEKVEESLESIQAKVQELPKSTANFQLDITRFKSMTQVKQTLSMGDVMQIIDHSPGVFYAITSFFNMSNKEMQAIVHVTINKNFKQCELTVYSSSTSFRDSIMSNVLDILSVSKI